MSIGDMDWQNPSIAPEVWQALELAADTLVDFVRLELLTGDSEELLDLLPRRYRLKYNRAFMMAFLEVITVVRGQMWDETTTRPVLNMAEQIALRLFTRQAEGMLEVFKDEQRFPPEELPRLQDDLYEWSEAAFPDFDEKLLYNDATDGIERVEKFGLGTSLLFNHWFDRFWDGEEFEGLPPAPPPTGLT